jgi:hypothetical protein
MIRVSVFALFLLFHIHTSGQRTMGTFHVLTEFIHSTSTNREYIDTVMAASFVPLNEGGLGCATGVYAAPDTGYVTGNNNYGDLQKAQFYSLHQMGYTAPGVLQGIQVFTAVKTTFAGFSQVVVQLYDVDTGGFRPGNLIAISNPISINDLDATGLGTTFFFPGSVEVGDSFFVSVVLPSNTGDTLALLSSIKDCSGINGWSWEQWSNGTWHTLEDSWIADIDLAIFPILDLPFNVGVDETSFSWKEASIFPNPASGKTTLYYQLTSPGLIHFTIFNAQGIKVQELAINRQHAGNYTELFDVKLLSAGYYVLLISSGTERQSFPLLVN